MESPSFNRFLSNRPYLNETTINKRYTFKRLKSDNVIEGAGHYLKKNYKPSWTCLRHQFKSRLPVVSWLRNYDVRENLLKDIVCGITMGIIEIPQSMGYSLMAGLPAVNGLYVCFFSAIMYFFFGTSRHMSIGTYGIVALMLDTYLVAFDGVLFPTEGAHKMGPAMTNAAGLLPTMSGTSHTSHIPNFFTKHARMTNPDPIPPSKDAKLFNKLKVISGDFVSDDRDEARVMIASCFSFYVGIFQIVFALLHAGVATKFLSDTVIAAFTTGAAYHVVASELHSLLGVKVGHTYGFFKIAEFLIEVFKNITSINLATCIISAFCLFELYMVKHFINHKYRAKLFAPVPIELIVIVLATLFTYLFRFDLRFGVAVIGDVPLGMPTPKVPPLYLFPKIYDNVIELSLVSFALNIAMAKLFAKKNNYEIRPNQEFFAYGVGNLLNSFFRGFPSSVGISRCVILDDIGARSLLHAAISSTIILIVILIVGFLMRWLPIACLASLIVVALIPMLFEVKRVVPLFKRSKIEGLAWMATFLSVVIIDVDFGLYVGIAAGLLLFIIQKQRANSFLMGNIPDTDIYEAINICDEAVEIEGIKIIRYESSIFYANVDNFVYRIFKLSGLNPNDVIEAMKKKREQFAKDKRKVEHMKKKMKIPSPNSTEDSQTPINIIGSVNESSETSESLLKRELSNIIEESVKIKDIIIDFSCVNLIDTMGLDALVQVNEAYKQIGVQLHLSHCKRNLIKRFNKSPLKNNFSSDFIYPTTHDAVLHIIFSRSNSHIGGDIGGLGNDAIVHSLIFADENAIYPQSHDLSIGLDPIYYAKRGDNINYSALEHVAFEV